MKINNCCHPLKLTIQKKSAGNWNSTPIIYKINIEKHKKKPNAKMRNEGLEICFLFGIRKMHAIKVNEKYKFNSLPRSRLINIIMK